MKSLLLILSLLLNVAEPDSANVLLYPDTLKLHEQSQAFTIPEDVADSLLLEWLALQSRQRADSADSARLFALHEQLRLDSIVADSLRNDSIRTILMARIDSIGHSTTIQSVEVEKHIFPDPEADREDIKRHVRNQYSPWIKEARTMVQLTQNYVTPNWYKGGYPSLALLIHLKGNITYKRGDLYWENTAELREGISTTSKSDTLHRLNSTDDLFRIYSKLGYQVYSKLYVSALVDFQTTLSRSWKENQNYLKTGFLTPIRFNIGLGLDYKPITGLSITFTPGTYKLVYANISDEKIVWVGDFGIDRGKNLLSEFGSSLRVEWTYKPLREIQLYSLLYFYTNYRAVEIDWQIEVDFIINRFLSTHLTLHPRYDTTVKSTEPIYPQFKELLSIGFNHYFR